MRTLAWSLCIFLPACGSGDGSGGSGGSSAGDAAGAGGGGGGTGMCTAAFANCSTYTDATADTADRTIAFTYSVYTPKCLQVKVGQTVTFSGSFPQHPLAQSCGPESILNNVNGSSKTFTFAMAGDYGYYCTFHGNGLGGGMAGSIQVVP